MTDSSKSKPPAAPVTVVNVDPVPVVVTSSASDVLQPSRIDTHTTTTSVTPEAKQVAAKAGTEADVLSTEGQRRINLLWERTQAIIAISVVEVTLVVAAVLIVTPIFKSSVDQAVSTAAVTGLVLLSNLVGNVTGFYFSRTNHTKIGGVGGGTGPQTRGE